MSSGKWLPFCLGLDVLNKYWIGALMTNCNDIKLRHVFIHHGLHHSLNQRKIVQGMQNVFFPVHDGPYCYWIYPWKCKNFSDFNTLRLRQNGRHFPDDIFKWIFINENVSVLIKISLKFVPGLINNIPALVQIMAWRRPGDDPLSEPICVTRSQWVKAFYPLAHAKHGCRVSENCKHCEQCSENEN